VKSLRTYILLLIFGFTTMGVVLSQSDKLPKVFLIGEMEEEYEKMMPDHKELLLTVCNNSMDLAYDKWIDMQLQMEAYSDSINFDISGVKVWINIFWNGDGTIRHIAYYPKPNSKNIDFDRYSRFLSDFISLYQMDIKYESGFSHYGSATFPTYPKSVVKDK